MPAPDLPALTLPNAPSWRHWLSQNTTTSKGVWLTIANKNITVPTSLTYLEALDEALCYGWIDSRGRKRDDTTHTYRFTPRATKGMWSKRNIGFVERLIAEGRMQPAGLATIEAAKADGRWDAAYSGPASAELPKYFLDAVEKDVQAKATWERLNRGNRYAVYMRLVGLRTEKGRERATRGFVEILGRGEGLVPQKGLKTYEGTRKGAKRKVGGDGEVVEGKVVEDEQVDAAEKPNDSEVARTTRSGRQAPSYTGQG
ncbi:hypothetical protein M409DRAFT_71064 [Zasmidium cellare ATCC 36951]|uniref:Uncharacterized protein n=1 Tax=Zasmidium cellare ATCC 36951 TaxID=1080233 RepID=A0A6A6BX80_ZASCE|nr:uncharacterized protein M409DRAFT_71064 [Zasmidium cellare ATCC 36951]KAF2159397.1 hypothetical protein M409DRAFT_71064 [Zasmidium cellare ATCC 36951]